MNTLPALLLITAAACSPEHEIVQTDTTTDPAVAPAPLLVVTTPGPAAWMENVPTVVSGFVQDATNVHVNGQAQDLDATGAFSEQIDIQRGINIIEVTADGDDGIALGERLGIIAGDFADPAEPIVEGMLARVNADGLDRFSEFGETLITAESLEGELAALNPIYSADPIIGTTIQADILDVDFQQTDILITPTPGALELQVALPDVLVDVNVYGEIAWIDFQEAVTVSAEQVTLTAEMMLSLDEDGTPQIALLDPEVTLADFAYDTSTLPSWIEDYFFTESIRSAIEDALVEQMQETVPEVLAETMATLDQDFSFDLLGQPVVVALAFDQVDVDAQGLALGVQIDVSVEGDGDKAYAGYLFAEGDPEQPDDRAPVSVTLSDNFVNRGIFELWRGGLADQTLSTEDGTLDPELLKGLPLETATIQTHADLPPVIVERDGLLELQLAELTIEVDTPGSSLGDHLTAKLDVVASMTLGIQDGFIRLELEDIDLGMHIIESDWGLTPDGLENIVAGFLSPEAVQDILDGLAVELPQLYGLALTDAVVSRADSGVHTNVTMDFSVAPQE